MAALLPGLLLPGLLTACSRPLQLEEPGDGAGDRVGCEQLIAALPDQVLDQDRRDVEPGVSTAAWGKPAITLRCGVAKPSTLNAASQCFEVNGVGWFAEEATGGYLFTTIGRASYVEVGVPTDYAPEATALVDLATAVTAHVPLLKPCA